MEVFAAFVAHTDHEIGRFIQSVKEGPHADNTLILYIVGDNGDETSGGINGADNLGARFSGTDLSIKDQLQHMDELGGPLHTNIYAAAWAWAGSTPFQWVKHVASHFGGTRNPLVVSWPARIKDHGGLRSQFTHVNDVAATLCDLAGIKFPEVVDGVKQLPLDGVSFVDSFNHADAPSRHRVQYFEAEGNRAIYQDGWLAAARHTVPWILQPPNTDFSHDRWELYHVTDDFSQAHDVAAQNPDELKALQSLFDAEARKNDVYPLGAGTEVRSPLWSEGKREFIYYAGFPGLALVGGPDFQSSHRITANVVIPANGVEGVVIASGSREGGFSLYVKNNHLVYENNFLGRGRDVITSNETVPIGQVELRYEFVREGIQRPQGSQTFDPLKSAGSHGGGTGRLYLNGRLVGERKLAHVELNSFGGVDIGQNSPSPVSQAYQPPFKFTGTIEKVQMDLK